MIIFIVLFFVVFIGFLIFLSSYELRDFVAEKFQSIFNKEKLFQAKKFAHELNSSSSLNFYSQSCVIGGIIKFLKSDSF